ncbi:hypothetical protein ABZ896_12225 [Streptomyces sp. NPDC047072]|uniref:hypothetical protein n=1 Tax=Streptomyces sp. NPDC047072 TaxID=3154809 RepID=UPI0033C2583B
MDRHHPRPHPLLTRPFHEPKGTAAIAVLLIGRWDDEETTLTVTASHLVADGDQAAIDRLFREAQNSGDDNWACAYDVDRHPDAVRRAYEEHAHPFDAVVEDDVEGFEPATY